MVSTTRFGLFFLATYKETRKGADKDGTLPKLVPTQYRADRLHGKFHGILLICLTVNEDQGLRKE